jgi:hypothetical protein
MGSVVDIVAVVHQADGLDPRPGLLGMLRIRVVTGVSRQSRAQVEEASVGDGVLVIVTRQVRVDLPS